MANDIPPGNYHPQPPEPRDPTAAELREDRLCDPTRYGLCVPCAKEGIETPSPHDHCDECWANHVASRKVNRAFLQFLYSGEPATLVTRDGERHHVTIAPQGTRDIPVMVDGVLVMFDRHRGESEIGYLEERAADHPVFLARVAEREKRERAAERARARRAMGGRGVRV